ncbi:MAG: hypothetical protein M3N93_14530, partial [Acidobacteriota bacterium]|nr:hypothetical protein [Acidobacteriota bacterium]
MAQTSIDLKNQAKGVDFSGATATKVWKMGTVLPVSCNAGEGFFLIGSGPNLYICGSQNSWSAAVALNVAGTGTSVQSVNGTLAPNAIPVIDATGTETNSGCTAASAALTCAAGFSGGTGATRLTASEGTPPAAPPSGQQTLYIDSADHNLKIVDNTGTVTRFTSRIVVPRVIPFAANPNGSAASGVSYPSGTWNAVIRSGANNIGAALQAIPSTGGTLQFMLELPGDWDPSSQPYIRIGYASGLNTSGTVVWRASSACSPPDGSGSDDPPQLDEPAFAPQNITAANQLMAQTGQFTAMVSSNNCVPGGFAFITVALSGTAASAINAYQ